MRYTQKTPVFCDYCPGFAMAELEGVVLCTGCLMRALMSSEEANLFDKIRPLDSVPAAATLSSDAPPPPM